MAIKNKMVYRDGKPVLKQESDRPGYSVDYHDDGKSKEKRLTEKERLRRKNGQKSGQKKRDAKMKEMQAKRQQTLEAKERNENYFQETLMLRDRTFYHGQVGSELDQKYFYEGVALWFTNNYAYAVMNALKMPYQIISEKISKDINSPKNLVFDRFNSLYERGYIFEIKTSRLNILNFYDKNDWKAFVDLKEELRKFGLDKEFLEDLYLENSELRKNLGRKDQVFLNEDYEYGTRNKLLKFINEKTDYDGLMGYEIKYELDFQSVALFYKSLNKIKIENPTKIEAITQNNKTVIKYG